MESWIKSSEFFIERAKKRVEKARQGGEGEQRHVSLLAEASRMEEQPPPTVPMDFAAELVQLRSLVAEAPARTGRVAV